MAAYSYTRLRDFSVCPYLFKLKHMDRVSYKENPMLQQGNMIHTMLERYTKQCYKDRVSHNLDLYQEIVDSVMNEYNCEPEVALEAASIFKHWIQSNEIQLEGLGGVELRLAVDKDWNEVDWMDEDVWFRVVLDRLYISGDQAKIVDYKTGYGTNKNDFQLKTYAWFIERSYPYINRVKVEYDYVRFFIQKEYEVDTSDITDIESHILSMIVRIENETEFKPNVSDACYTCPYWSQCPAMEGKEGEEYSTPDEIGAAAELVQKYISNEVRRKNLQSKLKACCEKFGDFPAAGMTVGYNIINKNKYDIPAILEDAVKEKVSVLPYFSVNKTALSRCPDALIADIFRRHCETSYSQRFQIKKMTDKQKKEDSVDV